MQKTHIRAAARGHVGAESRCAGINCSPSLWLHTQHWTGLGSVCEQEREAREGGGPERQREEESRYYVWKDDGEMKEVDKGEKCVAREDGVEGGQMRRWFCNRPAFFSLCVCSELCSRLVWHMRRIFCLADQVLRRPCYVMVIIFLICLCNLVCSHMLR